MTPLEYARMLAAFNSRAFYDAQGREFCCFCGAFDDHDPRCWGLGLPKIVAALEAAERLMERYPVEDDRAGYGVCLFCTAPNYTGGWPSPTGPKAVEHDEDCDWGALQKASKA